MIGGRSFEGTRRRLRKLASIAVLMRLGNSLALGVLFWSFSRSFNAVKGSVEELFVAGAWVSIAAFSYVLNDICDVQIDRINHPRRPLPSEALGLQTACGIAMSLASLAILLTIRVWSHYGLVLLMALLGGISYSLFIRNSNVVLANLLTVALVACVPLSSILTRPTTDAVVLVFGLSVVIFMREVQKDIADLPGDLVGRPAAARSPWYRRNRFFYSLLLVLASISIYVGTRGAWGPRSLSFIAALPSLALVFALVVQAIRKDDPRLQSGLLKLACYLTVFCLLLASNKQ